MEKEYIMIESDKWNKLTSAIAWTIAPYQDYDEDYLEDNYPHILELIKAIETIHP